MKKEVKGKIKKNVNEKYILILFVVMMFIICAYWTRIQFFADAPDEYMKYNVCEFIVTNNKLPTGGDESIRNPIWGISYAFMPILSYIFSAIFMKFAMIFTTNNAVIIVAGRLVNVFLYTATLIMIIKISKKLFEKPFYYLFIVLAGALPQFVFLGTYLNTDMLAAFSISLIVYSWLIGLENNWNVKSCISLAIGIGICALSYYNAYGFILTSIILFILSFVSKRNKINIDIKNLLKKGLLISGIVILIAGWWFIRNAIIYSGDFIGLKTENEYAEKYADEQYKPSKRITPYNEGKNLFQMVFQTDWISRTFKSFIAMFGNMKYQVSYKIYLCYIILFVITFIGIIIYFINYKNKFKLEYKNLKLNIWKKTVLTIIFILNMLITLGLSIYYSYFNDFQPQGRYIMPMLIPLMYFVTLGFKTLISKIIKNEKYRNIITYILSIGIALLPLYIFIFYIIPIYKR